MEKAEFLILGGGLAGLASALPLGREAVVLERERRPGGLVRSERIGPWWFDHVLHLLYFPDEATERRVRERLGDVLRPCAPAAWVHSRSGCVRFPFQAHLAGLPARVVDACLEEFAACAAAPAPPQPNYEALLVATFGRAMCDEFFLPYNRKMWKRPLRSLSPSGFHWNLQRPSLADVERGARSDAASYRAYNARGWYPRPRQGARRGMECLSQALAREVPDLRLQHQVVGVDLARRRVTVAHPRGTRVLEYGQRLISTLPLPRFLDLLVDPPRELLRARRGLRWNRVLSACFCVRGPRPADTAHWRYYADPALSFTRLIFMHAFDPALAPRDGWGLMAEITEPAEAPMRDPDEVLRRVRDDLGRLGLPEGGRIEDARLLVNEFGYVVFEARGREAVERAIVTLAESGVDLVGRYARWEYSSMAQVMRDGFRTGDRHAAERAGADRALAEALP